ncbi:MAG: polymorphic toxin type 50 domain-containing protein, partial [Egibacteraceae bacterium]
TGFVGARGRGLAETAERVSGVLGRAVDTGRRALGRAADAGGSLLGRAAQAGRGILGSLGRGITNLGGWIVGRLSAALAAIVGWLAAQTAAFLDALGRYLETLQQVWEQTVWPAIDRWVDAHADLLRTISNVLKWVALVVAVIALVALFVFPPAALLLGGIALGIGVAALGIDALLAATGNGSWVDVGIEAAFTFIPFGRLLGPLGRLLRRIPWGRLTSWIGRQAGRFGSWIGRQAGRFGSWIGRQAGRFGSWIGRQAGRLRRFLDGLGGRIQSWVVRLRRRLLARYLARKLDLPVEQIERLLPHFGDDPARLERSLAHFDNDPTRLERALGRFDNDAARLELGLSALGNDAAALDRYIAVHPGQQGKHIPGQNNYIPGRSELTYPKPQELLDRGAFAGTPVRGTPGQPGYRERVDFGQIIGYSVDPVTGARTPTSIGIIHYSSTGAHIVPARP